jgi:hypothetical protein
MDMTLPAHVIGTSIVEGRCCVDQSRKSSTFPCRPAPAGPTVLGPDANSISYSAAWSQSDPTVLTAAASNVLHGVSTIAACLASP